VQYGSLRVGLALIFGGFGTTLTDPSFGAADPVSASSNPSDASKSLPQGSVFTSIKQSAQEDAVHEVVRGHFELGSPPDVHRYYCVINTKTGKWGTNGVLAEPVARADGTTGIKNPAVSLFSCADAEQRGMLVTSGYGAGVPAKSASAPAPQVQAAEAPTPSTPAPDKVVLSLDQIDVAGVKLGMSPDEVRAVLKSKKLLDYNETAETLSYLDATKGVMQPIPNGRFVNVIAAWTAPPSSAASDTFQTDGESFAVMFTPVPGKERAMGIVHTVGYSPPNAVREIALESGLTKKYGGFSGSSDLPESPTWRLQSSGVMQVGDPCNSRGVFGGLGGPNAPKVARENLALKRTSEDFRFQIDHCGVAIVTEDHFTANGGALREDRIVTRFTVSAYSPSIGLEGARGAAQLIQAAGGTVKKSGTPRAKEQPASNL
jgi:hypothetical protein